MRNYHKKDKPILDHRITVRFEGPDYTAIERRAMQAEYPLRSIAGKPFSVSGSW